MDNKEQDVDQPSGSVPEKKDQEQEPKLKNWEVEEADESPANLAEPETLRAWKRLHSGKVTIGSLLILLFLWLERRDRSWKPTNIREAITIKFMRLFSLWVVFGLVYFLFTGGIWLLVSAPILAFPLRLALKYYFKRNQRESFWRRSRRRSNRRK